VLKRYFSIDSVIEEWIIFWRELRNAGFLTREGGGGGDPGEDRGVQGILGRIGTA
jgi:hypothetical protein